MNIESQFTKLRIFFNFPNMCNAGSTIPRSITYKKPTVSSSRTMDEMPQTQKRANEDHLPGDKFQTNPDNQSKNNAEQEIVPMVMDYILEYS